MISFKQFTKIFPVVIGALTLYGCGSPPNIANDTSGVTFKTGIAIEPIKFKNTGGDINDCAMYPELPAGLRMVKEDRITCTLSGTPAAIVSRTVYTVTASNALGDSTDTVTIAVDPGKPVLADAAAVVAVNGAAITPPISFDNTGGDIANCTVSPELPTGLTVTANPANCTISGTPTVVRKRTTYTVTATAADSSFGSDTATVDITVNPEAPVIADAAAAVAVLAGTAIPDTTFVNSGGPIANCTVSSPLPTGLSINPTNCTISGTPTTGQAPTTYTVTASNVTGSDPATVSVAVVVLVDAAPVVAVNGTAITDISFASSDGASASYAISPALSAGLGINATTGVISGTPTAVQARTTYTVTATAANSSFGGNTATVDITVNPTAPVIADAAEVAVLAGTAIPDTIFVNSGGPIANCTVSPDLPTGLTVTANATNNAANCTISGTPTTGQEPTTYTVTASNVTGSDTATVSVAVVDLVAMPAGGAVGTATADAVVLRWGEVAGASGYTVYRSMQSMALSTNAPPANLVGTYSATATPVAGSATTTHTTTSLDGNKYYFLVTSTTGGVESNTSNTQASAVPFATVTSRDTNRVWMSRNLGATRDCIGKTDTYCYGDLYNWGRSADGHQRIDRNPTTPNSAGNCWDDSIPPVSLPCNNDVFKANFAQGGNYTSKNLGIRLVTNANEWASGDGNGVLRIAGWADGGVNDICPAGFSVPILEELRANTLDAVMETAVTNVDTAYENFLKLSAAGFRNFNTVDLRSVGTYSAIWARSVAENNKPAWVDYGGTAAHGRNHSTYGFGVRCIKDSAPVLVDLTITGTVGTGLRRHDTTGANLPVPMTNHGSPITTCELIPSSTQLPAGITFHVGLPHRSCGVIGVPTTAQTATAYTVKGTNRFGSNTGILTITVN